MLAQQKGNVGVKEFEAFEKKQQHSKPEQHRDHLYHPSNTVNSFIFRAYQISLNFYQMPEISIDLDETKTNKLMSDREGTVCLPAHSFIQH